MAQMMAASPFPAMMQGIMQGISGFDGEARRNRVEPLRMVEGGPWRSKQRHRSDATRSDWAPRPLPQHLSLAVATWLNSGAILPALKLGSQSWAQPDAKSPTPPKSPSQPNQNPNDPRENLRSRWRDLLAEVERAEPVALTAALQAEGLRRFDQLLTGVEKYRHHPQHRALAEAPVLWSQGTTRLLDYRQGADPRGDPKAPRLLVVPSLVNRYYVLDPRSRAELPALVR